MAENRPGTLGVVDVGPRPRVAPHQFDDVHMPGGADAPPNLDAEGDARGAPR